MASDTGTAVLEQPARRQIVKINDVIIEVATMNGSGSQSANLVLARAIFQMGVPVGAKNTFPSNIQGLPTWFTIRANKEGWVGRGRHVDVLVAMNPDSVDDDLAGLGPGASVIIRDDLEAHVTRTDLNVIAVPFAQLVKEACEIARLRRLVVNMMYVGVLAHLLQIEIEEVYAALEKQFGRKPKALEINRGAVDHAWRWAKERLEPLSTLRIERMEATEGKVLIEGNRAAALGAIWGGVTVASWYPITPSSSVTETLTEHMTQLRRDPQSGKATFAIIQAEDELAAISMAVGAGWAGARSMTSTSGPGISLMAEQAGLAYFAEIPLVIVDVQRMGPSTGLPTRTCQGDILKTYYLSHGDCKHLLLIPGSMQECFDFACESFNIAERFQTLVFLMSELDLGMNLWMSDPLEAPSKPIDRGKVLSAEQVERMGGFKRYEDVDGDGIAYRTLPGTDNPKAAYFTRGTGHTEAATYSEKPEDWLRNIDRLAKKFETARKELPPPAIHPGHGARFGVIAYGSSDPAMLEALHLFEKEHGYRPDYLRIRALPPHAQVLDFIENHETVYVVEQNRDSQMASVLRAEWPAVASRLRSALHYGGMAIDAVSIVDLILDQEGAP